MPVTDIDEDVKDEALSILVGGDINWYNHLEKTIWDYVVWFKTHVVNGLYADSHRYPPPGVYTM